MVLKIFKEQGWENSRKCYNRIWGQVELVDKWHGDDGFRGWMWDWNGMYSTSSKVGWAWPIPSLGGHRWRYRWWRSAGRTGSWQTWNSVSLCQHQSEPFQQYLSVGWIYTGWGGAQWRCLNYITQTGETSIAHLFTSNPKRNHDSHCSGWICTVVPKVAISHRKET